MIVEYRTEAFQVKVTEDEAREAFPEWTESMGREGDNFEDHAYDAAEWAARRKLNEFLGDLPDDIEFEAGACVGVYLESEEDEP